MADGWICAECAATTAVDPCSRCGSPTALDGRYRLDEVLGRGAFGLTYRATTLASGVPVAIKELATGRATELKQLEMFAREARVLRGLDHPAIPGYVDDFQVGVGRKSALYLVQALIEGHTLARERTMRRFSVGDVIGVLDELLIVLDHLHSRSPPVIHRDLKPGNVMRRASDGRLVLIDFGSVRDALRESDGSTIAGTYGYMAPEQFRGHAMPASDLYALGVLAVVLLSGREPLTMIDDAHRLEWAPHVPDHPALRRVLSALLDPDPAMRGSPAAVRSALREMMEPVRPRADAPRMSDIAVAPVALTPVVLPQALEPLPDFATEDMRAVHVGRLAVPFLTGLGAWMVWKSAAVLEHSPALGLLLLVPGGTLCTLPLFAPHLKWLLARRARTKPPSTPRQPPV